MTSANLKAAALGAILVVGMGSIFLLEHRSHNKMREENHALQQQVLELAIRTAEYDRLSNLVAQTSANQSRLVGNDQFLELMRLRGEVGLLRKQKNELEKLREENQRLRSVQNSLMAAQRGAFIPLPGWTAPHLASADA